jgi:5-dehydro-2-deoxygluconokinase
MSQARADDRETASFDLITMGRVGVDLYPERSNVPLAEVKRFLKSLGGSPTNVAVAAARYGRRTAVITKVGEDAFGPYVRSALRDFGVDERWVGTDPKLRTPVVFCEIFPPDHFPILFYREPTAPDIQIRLDELDLDAIRRAKVFWTSGTGLSAEPSRTATLAALAARDRKPHTVHDLDYRPTLWPDTGDAGPLQLQALRHATVAVGNLEEVSVAVGWADPVDMAERLLRLGPEIAIVKMGGDGVIVAWANGIERIPVVPVEVVNGLGAGDAFGGALCHGLVAGWSPPEIVRFAAAAGAYVAAQLACADAMPDEPTVRALMREREGQEVVHNGGYPVSRLVGDSGS